MERIIAEFEPRMKDLFDLIEKQTNDNSEYMYNLAMDYIEDLVYGNSTLSPGELLKHPKYEMLRRYTKDNGIFTPFCGLAKECWERRNKI